jgi:hypothetical protein
VLQGRLITDLPVKSRRDAVEKLKWYALRWQIETFHKILKSGCKAEESKLRTAERVVNLISIFCIMSWRVYWMTMINRVEADLPAKVALTKDELRILDHLIPTKAQMNAHEKTLSFYLEKIARLGGYLARTRDPPPGNIVMWRGLARLTDIELGFLAAMELVGN